MNLVDELYAVTGALREAGIPYAVCGGIAVTMYGATRTTKDIDILIAEDDVSAVLEAVRPLGYTFAALPMRFEVGTARERHVQRVTKVVGREHLVLDFILASHAFAGLLNDTVSVRLPAGEIVAVSLSTLLGMKRMAGRRQDLADIENLERVVNDGDAE